MRTLQAISVLVVDDSAVFREILTRGLSSDDMINVVGSAKDAYEARDEIIRTKPQVIICDVEMPKMTGIEFVRQLMPQYPVPVIVVSAVSQKVFEAINAGAVDFVSKPDIHSMNDVRSFINELINKIKDASKANLVVSQPDTVNQSTNETTTSKQKYPVQVIAIGASMGGVQALQYLLHQLPSNIPGIVVVQHIPSGFSKMFAERLNMSTAFVVKEAKNGDIIEQGKVLIAPGGKHLRVKKRNTSYVVECYEGDKVSGHCPSADVLFDSVARNVGQESLGVILTGMGYDGARGLLALRRKGGRTLGQDEGSSVVYGMPKVAFELGAVQMQASLVKMADKIVEMIKKV